VISTANHLTRQPSNPQGMTMKIGDRVIFTNYLVDDSSYNDFTPGDTGVIKEVDSISVDIQINGKIVFVPTKFFLRCFTLTSASEASETHAGENRTS